MDPQSEQLACKFGIDLFAQKDACEDFYAKLFLKNISNMDHALKVSDWNCFAIAWIDAFQGVPFEKWKQTQVINVDTTIQWLFMTNFDRLISEQQTKRSTKEFD